MRSLRLGAGADDSVASAEASAAGFQRLLSLPGVSLMGVYAVPTGAIRSSAAGLDGSICAGVEAETGAGRVTAGIGGGAIGAGGGEGPRGAGGAAGAG
jgi:hypothetical protein